MTCEQVARAELGEPVRREDTELLWRCPHAEKHRNGDAHPSFKVNPQKDVGGCFVCGVQGKPWALAAFLAGHDASNKKAVTAWLKDHALLNGAKRGRKANGRGPCVAEYPYPDAATGETALLKRRYEPGAHGDKKTFEWFHHDGNKWAKGYGGHKPGLYRWAEVMDSPEVILSEGEKDADAGAAVGLPTVTSGGVNSLREDHAECLRGKAVVIVADTDNAGRIYAQNIAELLYGKAADVRVTEIPGCKDLAEAIERGWTRERLLALFREARQWRPATGEEILDSLMRFIRRFVSLTDAQARSVTLWTAHTHAVDAADFTPYLNINSAEKECGKTRLLEVFKTLVANPWGTENASAAALVHKIHGGFEKGQPVTVLFDERDSQTGGDKERAEAIRGILNSGYERGGCYSRLQGEGANQRVVDFQTFGAKALAGIGTLPDTVASRSVPVRMKRAPRGTMERFRKRDLAIQHEATELKSKLAAWAAANLRALKSARPEIPSALSDRQADATECLLGVADLAGGEWPRAGRAALIELCVGAQAAYDSVGVKLLADIKSVFHPKDDDGNPLPEIERVASEDLIKALGEMEGKPWPEWKSAKAITKNQLARFLSVRYEIGPKTVRVSDGRRLKGYEREQFKEAWAVYLPPGSTLSADSERDSVTDPVNTGQDADFHTVTAEAASRPENAVSAIENAACHGVTDRATGEEGGKEEAAELVFEEGEL